MTIEKRIVNKYINYVDGNQFHRVISYLLLLYVFLNLELKASILRKH